MNEIIAGQAAAAAAELCEKAKLKAGNIVVIGCSTSEVRGSKIGTDSNSDTGKLLFDAVNSVFKERGIYLVAQCCEHLNRCLIVERKALPFAEPVNVVPQPKAGGSFATAAYRGFDDPIAVEHIRADAGLDIGGTLIGMHLKEVAVPLRLDANRIGEASVAAARTRAKFIGGERAVYDDDLK